MRRIAYLSPVNPAPSGISDYSEELLPYLGQYADITLYLADGLTPANQALRSHLETRPIRRLAADQRRRPYDAILYHIGNSAAHLEIIAALEQTPGVAVLHDLVLHHAMLQRYAAGRGGVERYRAIAAARYGADGERVAGLMMRGRFTDAAFAMPFCEDVVAAADAAIAHSRFVADAVRALRPGLPVANIPMGVPLPPALDRAEARAALGLPPDAHLLASFGHINPYKRIDVLLRALAELRRTVGDVRFVLVGSVSPNYDLRAAVARAGLADAVLVTGYVSRARFESYVAAADVCVNLRHPTAGETSASLLRLLGAGRATLVTASGSFRELPPGVAAQVDLGGSEEDLIVAYATLLLRQPAIAAAVGARARAYVAAEHTLERSAAAYASFLAARYGWGDLPPQRPPLWHLEKAAAVERAPPPRFTAPPVASVPPDRADAPLPIAALAEAIAGIGGDASDAPLLRAAASAAAELGLGGER